MKRDQFTEDLSAKLHERGVNFDAAALDAFAAQIRREHGERAEVGSLADRFIATSRDYAQAMRKGLVAGHAVGLGLMFCFAGIGCYAIASLGLMILATGHFDPKMAVISAFAFMAGSGAMLVGVIRVVTAGITLIRSRREATNAFRTRRMS